MFVSGTYFLLGVVLGNKAEKLYLPSLVGFIFAGIILGPFVLDLFSSEFLNVSPD